jgi:hypothetical protein
MTDVTATGMSQVPDEKLPASAATAAKPWGYGPSGDEMAGLTRISQAGWAHRYSRFRIQTRLIQPQMGGR